MQIFVNYGRGGTEYISILFFIIVSTCTCRFKFEEIRWGILCRVCSWHTHNTHTHTHALKRVSSTLAYLFGRRPQKIGIDCSLFWYIFWTATETQNISAYVIFVSLSSWNRYSNIFPHALQYGMADIWQSLSP